MATLSFWNVLEKQRNFIFDNLDKCHDSVAEVRLRKNHKMYELLGFNLKKS